MNPNLAVMIDGGLFFGVIVAVCVWQLVSTARAKKRRLAREGGDGSAPPPFTQFQRRRGGAPAAPVVAAPAPSVARASAGVAVATGRRMIFTSAHAAIDANGALIGSGDLAAQTAQVMRNLGSALGDAGAGFADIVKTTAYVVDFRPDHRSVIGAAIAPYFAGRKPPASALVGVAALALADSLIEIEAVAVVE